MNAAGWAVLVAAGASAGVYCGALAALIRSRWLGGTVPFAGLLAGTALFAFARYFATAAPLSVLAALFCVMGIVQMLSARGADALMKSLAIVPLSAMTIVSIGQLYGTPQPSFFIEALEAALCAPVAIALALGLWNLHLIRKTALDRVR